MKPERTADDKLLALLARLGRPLERHELAKELGWSKQRVGAVLLRLVPDGRVVAHASELKPGEPGRPPALYALPGGTEPAPPAEERLPSYAPDTIVVTPSGREARVIHMLGRSFAEIEYLRVRLGHEPRATVHVRLLRAYQAGKGRPSPVRIVTPPLDVPDPTTA